MNRFERCLTHVLKHEGGYVDHPNDPGGATNFGITRKTLARWRRITPWWKLSKPEVRSIKQSEVSAIYHKNYWLRCRASLLPNGLDHALFDFAVNSGPERAIRFLQAIVGTKQDGIIGTKTLNAVSLTVEKNSVRGLIIALCDRRLGFLNRLSTFKTFGRGWTSRVEDVRRTATNAAENKPTTNSQINQTRRKVHMNILTGYKTYIVSIAMLIAGIGQMLGIDLPGFEGQASGQLIFEALAVLFLRRGVKNEVAAA